MSIVCAVKKDQQIAIAADTQCSIGSIKATAKQLVNSSKLLKINDSFMGIVGWQAIANVIEHLSVFKADMFKFSHRIEIQSTLLELHNVMKDEYFIETSESRNQPVESNHLDAIIINQTGLYEIGSYKEINEFKQYWAIGSGRELALGAMHAVYTRDLSAQEIAEAGANAAAEFDCSCGFPVQSHVMQLARPDALIQAGLVTAQQKQRA